MKIEILYFEGCPNHLPAVTRVQELVRQMGVDAEVVQVRVTPEDDAAALKFLGSPTILINGRDIDSACRENAKYGFSCRTYAGEGLPPETMIEQAIREALGEQAGADKTPPASLQLGHPHTAPRQPARGNSPVAVTVLGSVVAAVLASACCWVPLVLIGLGVSAGGVAGFFEPARPYLLVGSVVLLLAGFYAVYIRKPACQPDGGCCAANRDKAQRFNRAMFWAAAFIVFVFVLFPYYSPPLVRAFGGGASAYGVAGTQLTTFRYQIDGMTCPACAAGLEVKAQQLPGVFEAQVSYEDALAQLKADPTSFDPEAMIQAARAAGFKATLQQENGGAGQAPK